MTSHRPTVPPGTKGIYDTDARIRAQTARAMVLSRQTVSMTCAWPECVDPETGQPRQFQSRLIKGVPERRACSPTHRMRLWRQEKREQGYVQVTRDGLDGWLTPEGTFYPYPWALRQQQERQRTLQERRRERQQRRHEWQRVHQQAVLQTAPPPHFRRLSDSPNMQRFRAVQASIRAREA